MDIFKAIFSGSEEDEEEAEAEEMEMVMEMERGEECVEPEECVVKPQETETRKHQDRLNSARSHTCL